MQEFSVPPVAVIGAAANLTDMVWDNADAAPDTVLFGRRDTPGGQWHDVTCAQFRDEVTALAAGLVAAGVNPGDRVGLMSKTRYEWTLTDFAIWAAGGVTVPIYETSSEAQVEWILADSGAVAVVVETSAHRDVVDSVHARTALRDIWQIDGGGLEKLVSAGASVPAQALAQRRLSRGADDLATIIYTSGTTGQPKGCELTHRNLYADVANAVPGLPSLFTEGASTVLFLPLAHSFARLVQNGAIFARCKLSHVADVKNLVADLQSAQPTFVLSVPRVFEKVYNTARQRAYADGKGKIFDLADRTAVAYSRALDDGGPGLALRLRHGLFDRLVYTKLRAAMGGRCARAISGGAPLGERLAHFFRGIGLTIFEGYGLTETSPAIAVNLEEAIRIGTVGRPLPGVSVRIADDGEILVHGDVVFQGYWRNPTATAEVLDSQRWFATGDLGELDGDGYLKITGRKKEIIVTAGGKNVAPAVLEDRLRAHALVSQCLVVGDRQPFIAVLLTLDEDALPAWLTAHSKPADATAATLRDDADLRAEIQAAVDDANRAVSRAEAIREFRILDHDWSEATGEITPSLKVKRSVVLKQHAAEIASIYGG